jgi:hypothetical protein
LCVVDPVSEEPVLRVDDSDVVDVLLFVEIERGLDWEVLIEVFGDVERGRFLDAAAAAAEAPAEERFT